MGQKLTKVLKSQVTSSIFYLVVGLCLIFAPAQTGNIICRVIFGILLLAAGAYHTISYIIEKESATVVDMLSGVLAMVIGGFLFTNPDIVVNLLPILLGALVVVDSSWLIKKSIRLKEDGDECWKVILVVSLVLAILGIAVMVNPFQKMGKMLLFTGIVYLVNGACDLGSLMYVSRVLKNPPQSRIARNVVESRSFGDFEEPAGESAFNKGEKTSAFAGNTEEQGAFQDAGQPLDMPEDVTDVPPMDAPDPEKRPISEWKD